MVFCTGVRQLYCWIGGGVVAAAAITTVVLCAVLIPRSQHQRSGPNIVRNLLDLSAAERRAYLGSFDVVLTDCDGTVWGLTESIPGAAEGVAALRRLPKRVVFVTNNALRSDADYLAKFAGERIANVTMADVMHPGIAMVDYLQQTRFEGLIYAIASPNLRRYLQEGGFDVVAEERCERMINDFHAFDRYVHDGLPVKAVVLDYDVNMEMKQLARAEAYLLDAPDAVFLAGATDERIPLAKPTVGPGPVLRLLEQLVGRRATVLAKPGEAMRDVVMRKFGVAEARRILFIGDTLEQDVGFGRSAGFQTLAVLTGAASLESIAGERNADWVPDFYVPSFADFVELCREA